MGHISVEDHLEARERVVAEGAVVEDPVTLQQLGDGDVIVKYDGARLSLIHI